MDHGEAGTSKCFQMKKSRTKRKGNAEKEKMGAPSLAAEDMHRTGTHDGEAQDTGEINKGHCVEQPLVVSDEEGRNDGMKELSLSDEEGGDPIDEESSEEYVPDEEASKEYALPDEDDHLKLAVSDEKDKSSPVENLPLLIEDDDGTKIEKLSFAMKEGTTIMCLWRDGAYHPAKVLDVKEHPAGCFKYYISYTEFDRRNDKWLELKELKFVFTRPVADNKADTQTRSVVMTRHQTRKLGKIKEHEELDPESLHEHEELTKVKKINSIQLGKYEIETWYWSPFPSEYDDCEKLFFCEFCLTFLKKKHRLERHMKKNCNMYFPPGMEIYCSESLSVFEVDGNKQRVYGENLCYLAKLFLDHKSLRHDVGAFLFYILCEKDMRGFHIVAYFSKEVKSEEGNNLACILTLPPYQKRGYGNFLISFSYELSKREGKVGQPEHPLSDLGRISYKKYWTEALLEILSKKREISIEELSKLTAITAKDIIETLKDLDLILYRKGEHMINANPKKIQSHLMSLKKSVLKVEPEKLKWRPPVRKA